MKIKAMFTLVVLLTSMCAWADSIYIESGGNKLYVVDSNTGASTFIGPYALPVVAQAFSPNGTLYAITRGGNTTLAQLATVNLTTGAQTLVGSPTGVQTEAMAFTPDGTLYAANFNTNNLYTLNPSTGAATLVGALGFTGIMDLAWDPANSTMYAVASLCNGSSLYSINLSSGAGTLVTPVANSCLMSLAIDSSNRLLTTDFANPNSPLYQIDVATGNLTSLGNTGLGSTMGATAAPVPEPATLTLLASGILSGVVRRRKRNRR